MFDKKYVCRITMVFFFVPLVLLLSGVSFSWTLVSGSGVQLSQELSIEFFSQDKELHEAEGIFF